MKEVVFTYGRFNPPTRGHEMMIQKMKGIGKDTLVVVSHTQNKKKNPLNPDEKLSILRKMFPNVMFDQSSKERQLGAIIGELKNKYNRLTMVVGSNRVNSFSRAFKDVDRFVVAGGERTDNETNISGIKATFARNAAVKGQKDRFKTLMSNKLDNDDLSRIARSIHDTLTETTKRARKVIENTGNKKRKSLKR